MKSDAHRRHTFEKWQVPFIVKNHLASAGFYYTNWRDVVCRVFCGVELGHWEEEDPFKHHQR